MQRPPKQIAIRLIFLGRHRRRLWKEQAGKCCFCGCDTWLPGDEAIIRQANRLKMATVEHIVPLSKGGTDDPENFKMSCYKCNSERMNLDYDIWMFIMGDKTRRKWFNEVKLIRRALKLVTEKYNRFKEISKQGKPCNVNANFKKALKRLGMNEEDFLNEVQR